MNWPSLAQQAIYRSWTGLAAHPMQHCESNMAKGCSGSCQVWDTVQTGQFTHGLLPVPDKKLSSNLFALNGVGIRVVTRMLNLHKGLNNHMCRIGRHFDPLCSRCGEGQETPSHLFENWATFVAIKFSIFDSTTTTLGEAVRNRRLEELLKFVSRAALCC